MISAVSQARVQLHRLRELEASIRGSSKSARHKELLLEGVLAEVENLEGQIAEILSTSGDIR